jgi:hypothetical protein
VSEPKVICPECNGTGCVWTDPHVCTCGQGPGGFYGQHEPLCGAEPCPSGCEVPPRRTCPDEGYCHHWCGLGGCFRVAHAGPLSIAAYPGDDWPEAVITAERELGGRWWAEPVPGA